MMTTDPRLTTPDMVLLVTDMTWTETHLLDTGLQLVNIVSLSC